MDVVGGKGIERRVLDLLQAQMCLLPIGQSDLQRCTSGADTDSMGWAERRLAAFWACLRCWLCTSGKVVRVWQVVGMGMHGAQLHTSPLLPHPLLLGQRHPQHMRSKESQATMRHVQPVCQLAKVHKAPKVAVPPPVAAEHLGLVVLVPVEPHKGDVGVPALPGVGWGWGGTGGGRELAAAPLGGARCLPVRYQQALWRDPFTPAHWLLLSPGVQLL